MNSKLLEMRNREDGFTLVELLIVIVVLGILAGITVFGVASFRANAADAACDASRKTVSVAAEAYNAAEGAYPADVAALVSSGYLKEAPSNGTATIDAAGEVTFTCTAG